jgi:hypothetical protein
LKDCMQQHALTTQPYRAPEGALPCPRAACACSVAPSGAAQPSGPRLTR